MDKIRNVVDSRRCIGCGNCVSTCKKNAISFKVVNGFLYPDVDLGKCNNCGVCDSLCPIDCHDIFLSDPKEYYAAYVQQNEMRLNTTSGGLCTFASEEIIRRGGVVFSVMLTDEWKAVYSKVEKKEDLSNHVGSRYMQAESNNVQRDIASELKGGKSVLLIGTPCFVSAVKKFLKENRINPQNFVTIDFLCHGVPSAEIASAFIKSLEKKDKKLENYNFRSKKGGWGRLLRSVKYVDEQEKVVRADFCPLHTWFGRHLSLRESFFKCDYRNINRPSDITVADFWKIDRLYPDFPMKQGVSAVQINTGCGERFFMDLLKTGKIVSKSVSKESIWGHRKTGLKNFAKPPEYDVFWNVWNNLGLLGLKKKFPPMTYFKLLIAKIKSFFYRGNI